MAFDSPLLPVHQAAGAKLVEFAGWRLPVQFSSVAEEVRACRSGAALFDISHMGLLKVTGPRATAAVSGLLTRDMTRVPRGCGVYALLLNERAGVRDDLFAFVISDSEVMLVVNAVNHERDAAWIRDHLRGAALEDPRGSTFGIALQGPEAERILGAAAGGQEPPSRFAAIGPMRIAGAEVLVSRTGYTGEDGFEVFGEAEEAVKVWEALAGTGEQADDRRLGSCAIPRPAGLAARDVLRLEMGYPLWGHELDEETTPREAGLEWAVDKGHDFIGRAALESHRPARRRIGLMVEGRGVARAGDVIAQGEEPVGAVTSGTYSHNLDKAIAQGYVRMETTAAAGDELSVRSRGRALSAVAAGLPFIPARTRPSWRKEKRA